MKLTNVQIEQILERAPQGAIEYCLYDYGDATHPLFLNCENQFYEEEWVDMLSVDNYFHSRTRLSDLREILTLRRCMQKLKNLTQAVVDAWDCGDNDDLQRACGAIVDYTKEYSHDNR